MSESESECKTLANAFGVMCNDYLQRTQTFCGGRSALLAHMLVYNAVSAMTATNTFLTLYFGSESISNPGFRRLLKLSSYLALRFRFRHLNYSGAVYRFVVSWNWNARTSASWSQPSLTKTPGANRETGLVSLSGLIRSRD
jgi:hypothetical protein